MADVALWSLYAYFNEAPDDGSHDVRREIFEYQIEDELRWARVRGYDTIMLTRTNATTKYRPGRPVAGIRHSGVVGRAAS